MKTIPAARAKAGLLALLDQVARSGQSVIITKRGKAVARIAPLEAGRPSLKARARIVGDVVSPVKETWFAP
jgi:prevent-host-death family protein